MTKVIPEDVKQYLAIQAAADIPLWMTKKGVRAITGPHPSFTEEMLEYYYRSTLGPGSLSACPAEDVLNYLKGIKQLYPAFFYSYELNDAGDLMWIFWQSEKMREYYGLYHYVIGFDNTYSVSRFDGYKLGIFTSEDAMLHTAFLGFSLMLVEDTESYAGVFKAILQSVGCKEDALKSIELNLGLDSDF